MGLRLEPAHALEFPERVALEPALSALLTCLSKQNYQFITPSPLTHSRFLAARQGRLGSTLRDVFGWSMPFSCDPGDDPPELPEYLLEQLRQAGIVREIHRFDGSTMARAYQSTVRVSSSEDGLFIHSAYPTDAQDSVFFGPDTYRFLRLIKNCLLSRTPAQPGPRQLSKRLQPGLQILDVGCGSGAGGLVAARCCPDARLVLNDINPLALSYAAINAQAAGINATLAAGDALNAVTGNFDVIVSNPPYLMDDSARAYRHGGNALGRALSVRIACDALHRLAPGGQLILYTGVAIVDGIDLFIEDMRAAWADAACTWHYSEIDPDVFGEELERPAYRHIDRIAAVALIAVKD